MLRILRLIYIVELIHVSMCDWTASLSAWAEASHDLIRVGNGGHKFGLARVRAEVEQRPERGT
jgi:hypothetical protein